MDRFVPRDDKIFVTARSAATRQSMDRFVPRDDEIFVTERSAATRQFMDRSWLAATRFFVRRCQMSRLRASGGFCEKYCKMPRIRASVSCF